MKILLAFWIISYIWVLIFYITNPKFLDNWYDELSHVVTKKVFIISIVIASFIGAIPIGLVLLYYDIRLLYKMILLEYWKINFKIKIKDFKKKMRDLEN